MKKTKHVKVEYIESGAFQGSESDTNRIGIEYGEECIVIKKTDFEKLEEFRWKYEELCK